MHEIGRARRRRALDLQAAGGPGRPRPAVPLAARAARHPRHRRPNAGGVPRAHQARDVPGPGVLLHAQGRPDRAAARRHAGRLRLCRALARSATPASAPRSTAACCRCAPSCRTATRSRSSPRRRRRRRRPGSASSSPARREAAHPPLHPHAAARAVPRSRPSLSQKTFRQEGYEFTEKAARRRAAPTSSCATVDDSIAAVGAGLATGARGRQRRLPGLSSRAGQETRSSRSQPRARAPSGQPGTTTARSPIRGLIPGMAVHFAGCCHPLPGDRIVGIVTTGKGVTIHTIDCDTLGELRRRRRSAGSMSPGSSERGRRRRISAASTSRSPTSRAIWQLYDDDRQAGRQHHQPEDHQPLDRFLRDRGRYRGRRREAPVNIIAALRATPAINSVERARG